MTKLWLIANELRENQATVNILYSPIWWRYLYVYKHNDNRREKFRIKVKCQISNLNEISKWIPNKLCCEDQRVRAWHFQHVSSFQLLSHSFIFLFNRFLVYFNNYISIVCVQIFVKSWSWSWLRFLVEKNFTIWDSLLKIWYGTNKSEPFFSYASSSTLYPRQRVIKWVIVSDCNLLA